VQTQLTAAVSPFCEFNFHAAGARRTVNAASAKSSALPRGEKTGHSCKAQQDQSGELTECGRSLRTIILLESQLTALRARSIK
jgi:hypothetical protein